MNKKFVTIPALSLATALLFAQSKPAFADVVVNNVLSPFTVIQVGPGHRVYSSSPWGFHPHNHYTRCYTRWDPYIFEWRQHCVRRHYGGGDSYYRGGDSYYRGGGPY